MANTSIIINDLTEGAVKVYSGMIAVYPQFAQEEILNISELAPKFNGCFAMNNSTVCFVSDNEVFVIPYTRKAIRLLNSAGFCQKGFYVPFSNGDYPKSEQMKWKSLCANARQSYEEDFAADCIAYCDKHHIGAISKETLENCFEMPTTGVKVKHPYFEDCYYPIIKAECFDCTAAEHIGHFCANNGKVIFVYRNGKTYVAKGYKILNELSAAGYTKAGLFVPFSNGERILDAGLKARWEAIGKC